MTKSRAFMGGCVESRAWQSAGVVLAFLLVAVVHRGSDGLWFQGDAPRHAVNGFFWWDLLKALPKDPVTFAVRYYARYPVIAPATYPPLFYIFEGVGFAAFGPSPQIAKSLVVMFGAMTGLYTMAWARRWIAPTAGWAGAFLAFVPGIVLWSNTVMLNIPATAMSLASLYHFRRWLETAHTRQLAFTTCFLMAVLLTYYPSASVLTILAAWTLFHVRALDVNRHSIWIGALALVAAVPLIAALALAPVHTSRHLPTIAFLSSAATWTFYWRALPGLVGIPVMAIGTAGLAAALLMARWRSEASYVASWILILILALSLLPARDPRYVLLTVPAFIIAAAMGVVGVARRLPPLAQEWRFVVLMIGLLAGLRSAARVHVPQVSGFRELAIYLQREAPTDAVLYDGAYDGLFGFHVRAADPNFERRLVLASKLLYAFGPTNTFKWVLNSNVSSTDDVVNIMRTRSGCRWVAVEVEGTPPELTLAQRLLRGALDRTEFESVGSFPIAGAGDRRVDLYRFVGDVEPVASVDLRFPSFSNRDFANVVPITR